MIRREPVVIDGKPIGRIKASFLLFKESWRYLSADKEMIWIPLLTAFLNLFLLGLLAGVFFVTGAWEMLASEDQNQFSPLNLLLAFVCYVIGAFTLALSQAGIVHTVYTRSHGGNATLGQSLKAAFSHSGSLFLWSLVTATVGLLLRVIFERSEILGKILSAIIGGLCPVLTYFVVPAMVIDKKSAFASIGKSGQVFKKTWGESIVSNVSLGITFLLIHLLSILSLVGLLIVTLDSEQFVLAAIFIFGYLIWFDLLALVYSALQGVLLTLLYIYAAEGTYPPNFNQELLGQMLRKNNVTPPQSGNLPANSIV